MRKLQLVALASILMGACSASPTPVPTKNLERPSDMGFLCLAMVESDGEGELVLSGQPLSTCHPDGSKRPPSTINDERKLGTFGFIIEDGRGDLAAADLDISRLVDLSPATAGYGFLPFGSSPRSVATSADGCHVAVSTQSECSIAFIDPSRLLASAFLPNKSVPTPSTGAGPSVRNLTIKTPSGVNLRSTIGEMAFMPSVSNGPSCKNEDHPKLVATFPGCDMVGILDVSPQGEVATLTSAFRVLGGGVAERVVGDPVCPVECGPAPALPDAGTPSLGNDRSRLEALVLVPDGSSVFVAGHGSPTIQAFPISGSELGDPASLTLAEGAMGVSRLRLSVDTSKTIKVVNQDRNETTIIQGKNLSDRDFFLYAFAGDGSLRVVDVNLWGECDVNVLVNESRNQACFPVGTSSTNRRPLALGPGIQIQTRDNPDQPPPLARDIAFVDLQPPADETTNPQALRGQFAFLLASNGYVYILNLAPSNEDRTITHSFREYRELGKSVHTPLAMSILPQRLSTLSDQPFSVSRSFVGTEAPNLGTFQLEGATQYVHLPDPDHIVSNEWDIVWEGVLPRGDRSMGVLIPKADDTTAGLLLDRGANFCSVGARPGDLVFFPGCGQDTDCQPEETYYCEISTSSGRGLCLPRNRKLENELRVQCGRFLNSRMRYEIQATNNETLSLGLLIDEVPKTSLYPCEQDEDCRPDPSHQKFQCLQLRPGEAKRCVQTCTKNGTNDDGDANCRSGHVCELVPGVEPLIGGLCVEAPLISTADQACWPQPMFSYRILAGKSYLVQGDSLPKVKSMMVAPDGACRVVEQLNSSLQDRIPLSAPACSADMVDQIKNGVPAQSLEPEFGLNPCLYRLSDDPSLTVFAYFQNPQIRFVLKNLDTYVADIYSIHFGFQYGFSPITVALPSYEILLTAGVRIITGPTRSPESPVEQGTGTTFYPYLYVIDQGRTALTSGSRGQVLRINPRSGSSAIATFDYAVSGSTPFQLQ